MTRTEAQDLIQVLKKFLEQDAIQLPRSGLSVSFALCSVFSKTDRFTIIMNRSSKIRKDKYTLLLRYGKDIRERQKLDSY